MPGESRLLGLFGHRLGWNRVEYVKITGKYSAPSGHLESLLFLADYY
eukprot:COSAG02_NODE_816_length_16859_cov_15.645764_15_plen_47_part_00